MRSHNFFSLRSLFLLLLLTALVVASGSMLGCAGSRGDVRFDGLSYPASMSGYLHDSRGRVVSPKALTVVGEFEEEGRLWGAVFSWVPVTGTVDVSEAMNREIAAAGGEAMINVEVESDGCAMNYVPIFSLLPMWPGCADVKVKGQIVRLSGPQRTRSASR